MREQFLGSWEKTPLKNIPDFFSGGIDPPGGESMNAFQSRSEQALQDIFTLDSPVPIISHGAVWYRLLNMLKIERRYPGSCKAFRFQKMGDGFSLKEV